MKSLILALALLFQTATTPTISTTDKGATFKVTYPRGAIWTCVVFRMTEPTEADQVLWPGGYYAPRSCGPLDSHSTTFTEEWNPYIRDPQTNKDYDADWDVYAEIQYPNKDGGFREVETNRVRVHR